jgi:DnaJ-class molecular chaperone
MNYFLKINDQEKLKQEYRKLALINHPDRGGSTETMQKIISSYKSALKVLENPMESVQKDVSFADNFEDDDYLYDLDDMIEDLVDDEDYFGMEY